MDSRIGGRNEIRSLAGLLARLSLETKLIRLERERLRRKGWEDQPRAPAGRTDGGQWVGGSGGFGGQWTSLRPDAPPAPDPESTTLEDGTRVLSIRVRAGRRSFDAQDTVVAPDGESRVFETSGPTQTIRDGATGEILSRSTFTPSALVPEAVVQPAFLPAVPLAIEGALIAIQTARTLELALSLFAALQARKDGFGTVLGLTAHEYTPGDAGTAGMVAWVGKLDQTTLDAACPRNGEVHAIADAAARAVRASGNYRNATDFGNKVHILIAKIVNSQEDSDFKAEVLLNPRGGGVRAREPGNVRLDLFEHIRPSRTVCVYDHKTGMADLSMARAMQLARAARENYPDLLRIIIIQVRTQ